jgi:lipopolysaccharide exporter
MAIKFIRFNELFRNISTLVAGTLVAQFIVVVIQIFLRRIFPAEDFGAFAIYISITGILMILATFRYEMAIVLPEKTSDATNMVFLGIILSFLFNLILFFVIFFFKDQFADLLNLKPSYSFILYFSPVSIFLFSSYQVINYYLVREKKYNAVSVNKISRRFAEGVTQTGLGMAGKYSTGLIYGDITGHLVNNIAGWVQLIRGGFIFRYFSIRSQWQLLLKFREFPVYNLIPSFLNAASMHLPLIMIARLYAQETAAYFDLTRWVLAFPASLLALSISQVMLQSISEKSRKKLSIRSDIRQLIVVLSIISATMVIFIMLWGPWLFSIYAGSEYRISGVFAQILVAGAAIKLVVSPLSSTFIALNRIRLGSVWQAAYFICICSLFLLDGLEVIDFLKIYLAIDIFMYGIYLALILSIVGKYEKNLKNQLV